MGIAFRVNVVLELRWQRVQKSEPTPYSGIAFSLSVETKTCLAESQGEIMSRRNCIICGLVVIDLTLILGDGSHVSRSERGPLGDAVKRFLIRRCSVTRLTAWAPPLKIRAQRMRPSWGGPVACKQGLRSNRRSMSAASIAAGSFCQRGYWGRTHCLAFRVDTAFALPRHSLETKKAKL